jgi:hypothetical protein
MTAKLYHSIGRNERLKRFYDKKGVAYMVVLVRLIPLQFFQVFFDKPRKYLKVISKNHFLLKNI